PRLESGETVRSPDKTLCIIATKGRRPAYARPRAGGEAFTRHECRTYCPAMRDGKSLTPHDLEPAPPVACRGACWPRRPSEPASLVKNLDTLHVSSQRADQRLRC